MPSYSSSFSCACLSLLLGACATTAEPEASSSSSSEEELKVAKAKTITIDMTQCPNYYDVGAIRAIEPGAHLVLTAPSDYQVEEIFGFEPALVPGWTQSYAGDQLRLDVTAGPSPVEFFAGVSRIVAASKTGSAICYFDIVDKNVIKVSSFRWLGHGTVDRDLGSVRVGGSILIEGSPFGGHGSVTTLLEQPGDAKPTRITSTSTGYGSGTYVFEAKRPGNYAVDVHVVMAGYTDHVSHVHWRVKR